MVFLSRKATFLFVLIALFALASCRDGIPSPTPPPSDWCYTFLFTTTDYSHLGGGGSGQPFGTWVNEEGYTSDDSNRLSFSYDTGGLVVQPTEIFVTAGRAAGVTGSINFHEESNIFGITTDLTGALPDGMDSSVLTLDSPSADASGAGYNINVSSSARVTISSMEIFGNGLSPFDTNPCAHATSTPTIPFLITDTPSGTPVTPTITPTPSDTSAFSPTPSPTATSELCDTYIENFDGGTINNPWGFIDQGGTYGILSSGDGDPPGSLGYDPSTNGDVYGILFPAPVSISRIEFYDKNLGGGGIAIQTFTSTDYDPGSVVYSFSLGDGAHDWSHNGGTIDGGTNIRYMRLGRASADGSWIDNISIDYCYLSAPTNTPTPGPTDTGTPPPPTATVTAYPSTSTATGTITPVLLFTLPPLGTLRPAPTAFGTPLGTPMTGTPAPFGGTGTPGLSGGTPAPGGTPGTGPGGTSGGSASDGGAGTASGIGNMGGAVLAFGTNAMNIGFSWLGEIALVFTNVTTAWVNAVPQPIPDMPDCVSSGALSQVCAIFYMLQYTVFSGLIGSLLIPLATAVMYLWIILNFLLLGRAILERLGIITKT